MIQACVVCGKEMEIPNNISGYVVCWNKTCRKKYKSLRNKLIQQNPKRELFEDWIFIDKK